MIYEIKTVFIVDELSLMAWRQKLLCSLAVRQSAAEPLYLFTVM